MSELIEEVRASDAAHFLSILDPVQMHWGQSPTLSWVFRGHSNAKWKLVPRLWRQDPDDVFTSQSIGAFRSYASRWYESQLVGGRIASGPAHAKLKDLSPQQERDRIVEAFATLAAEEWYVHEFASLADEQGFDTGDNPKLRVMAALTQKAPPDTAWPRFGPPDEVVGFA